MSAIAVRDELFAAIEVQLEALANVLGTELESFNSRAAGLRIPAIDPGK